MLLLHLITYYFLYNIYLPIIHNFYLFIKTNLKTSIFIIRHFINHLYIYDNIFYYLYQSIIIIIQLLKIYDFMLQIFFNLLLFPFQLLLNNHLIISHIIHFKYIINPALNLHHISHINQLMVVLLY